MGVGEASKLVCVQGDWSEIVICGLGWFICGLGLTWQVYVIKTLFYLSIYFYCITPSRRLHAGARQCGVSGRNAFKNKKFP